MKYFHVYGVIFRAASGSCTVFTGLVHVEKQETQTQEKQAEL